MKRAFFIFFILTTCLFSYAQTASDLQVLRDSQSLKQNQRIASMAKDIELPNPILAMSNPNYYITAGDIYVLGYAAGTTPVTYELIVDSSYKLRVSNLAVIDVEGKTYIEVKNQVEQIVSKNYPLSGVQFVLKSPAVFTVTLKGEVSATAEPQTWALQRLSSLLDPYLTSYSSTRNIEIISKNGKTTTYDLFKASRNGDLSQDPYLRPGDTIHIGKLSRSVSISGAVERPGTYELLEGENLKDLIEVYGSGLTPKADPSRIELERYVESTYAAGEKIFFNSKSIENNEKLQNLDAISIPQITDLSPVMFIEGAVGVFSSEDAVFVSPENTNKVTIQFNKGENYASLVRRYKSLFSAVSDLYNAYIIRGIEEIPINLNPILYDASFVSEHFIEANDTLIIPFRQYFVTVSGAVRAPGRYPYIPDRDWSYYVSLAGGFHKTENANNSIVIKDILGKTLKKTDPITPETVIEAKSNSFFFYFNLYSPIVVTTLSVITTFLSFLALTAK